MMPSGSSTLASSGRELEQIGQQAGGAGGAVGGDRTVGDGAPDLGGDRVGQGGGVGVVELHAPAGPVSAQPVRDMEVLLKMVPEWHIDERPAGGGQLHTGRQSTLDDS